MNARYTKAWSPSIVTSGHAVAWPLVNRDVCIVRATAGSGSHGWAILAVPLLARRRRRRRAADAGRSKLCLESLPWTGG